MDRARALREAETFVFLCSGNMVRSAFAELYAQHTGFPLPVRSAATNDLMDITNRAIGLGDREQVGAGVVRYG